MSKEKIRTFICIEFPDEIIKEVIRMQLLLKNKKFAGRLIEPENLHLTLKFLGEISQNKLSQVENILSGIYFGKFKAKLRETGTFSHKGMPKIAWIKITGGKIFSLQKEIDEALSDLFEKENRFMSHLTIARIKYVKDQLAFNEYIKNLPIKSLEFSVDNFEIKSSELTPFGPKYMTLKTYPLK